MLQSLRFSRVPTVAACSALGMYILSSHTASASASAEQTKKQQTQAELKRQVGFKAVDDYVASNMIVGLGTGSTASFALQRLAQKLASRELHNIKCVPTSAATHQQAKELGLTIIELSQSDRIDVVIDGADDVDRNLALVKGGGGALLREKMVESFADTFVCIVDESKLHERLGPGFSLPVEITPFSHKHIMRTLAELPSLRGCKPKLRRRSLPNSEGWEPVVTDNGNYIVDLEFQEPIKDLEAAAREIKNTVGVLEHGLFLDMASVVMVATPSGIRTATRSGQTAKRNAPSGEKPWW